MTLAVVLSLADMEDFVLIEMMRCRPRLPLMMALTYQVRLGNGVVDQLEPRE